MTEPGRRQRNIEKLEELNPAFRLRVQAIIADLEAVGYRPRIQVAFRGAAAQALALGKGASTVSWSMHQAETRDGKPDALAVDLLDDDAPRKPGGPYLLRLAAIARRRRCITGILWGKRGAPMTVDRIAAIEAAILAERWDAPVRVGFDPCHVQPAEISLSQARAGARP